MGAVTFSLDPRLVTALQSALPLKVLIETGTFKGDTVAKLATQFDKIVSIELSETLWSNAVKRFDQLDHVKILYGNSPERLGELRLSLENTPTLYWLDAHWCIANDTTGELSQCPLLDELRAIGKLNNNSVILIDDARLFLAPPPAPHEISQWPNFNEVLDTLRAASGTHQVMVLNDTIIFSPPSAGNALREYGRQAGVDWLGVMSKVRDYDNLQLQFDGALQQLEEKERTIQEKESAIQDLSRILAICRAIFSVPILGTILRLLNRARIILRPRLGNLNQYPARALTLQKAGLQTEMDPSSAPKISLVTPSYQQGLFIERTIKSVVDQKYPNLEYFVQDGGSSDQTVSIIKSYAQQLSGWRSAKDNGQSQAINLGFANTTGEIMGWLNSDDLLLPCALAYIAEYFASHPEVDVLYGNRLMIDGDDMEIGRWIMPGHDSAVLSWVDYVPQETMFWRRRIWDKAGGQIDETFKFAMDWDLLVRFRDAGAKFAHIPQFIGAFRIHKHQKTSAAINEIGHQEMDWIRERLLGRVPSLKRYKGPSFLFC